MPFIISTDRLIDKHKYVQSIGSGFVEGYFLVMVVHACRGRWISLSSRPAWSTEKVPGQPGLHKENPVLKQRNKPKKEKEEKKMEKEKKKKKKNSSFG